LKQNIEVFKRTTLIIKVNINPAYRAHELEYSLHKVGCKALIMSDKYKSVSYVEMLKQICPEVETSMQGGQLSSKKLPALKHLILIGKSKHE
jgi:fatty-acyl-CoA synthase